MRRPILFLLASLLAVAAVPAAASAAKSGRCLLRGSGPQCYAWTGKVTFVADGDTIYVDVDGDGTRARRHVRITGLQAMEQTVYAGRASRRRGECHAIEATARLDQLLEASRYRVRLLAQDPASRSGRRLRRSVAVKIKGRWRDVGRTLVGEGHALWLPNHREHAWNRDYSILAGRAARAQWNLWNPGYCAPGPSEGAPMQMWVNWDADGNDNLDPNGEWVRIKNPDPVNALPLGGWYLRDSALRRFRFPDWASVPPGGEITVYGGVGDDNDSEFYWGLRFPAFENVTRDERAMGDGAYLFDPEGDLRLAMTYPCREACADLNQGALQLAAQPKGREAVQITNVGGGPVDLEPYRLTSSPYGYSFAQGSVLQPGETMRVRLWESFRDDSALIRYWPNNRSILNNGGDAVQLRRYDDVVIACTAWGSHSC
ncbi:MAG: lamin tail domain-containing protein [Solirubrobacteraceae bacterium]